jgi:hypothetical protein
MKSSGSVGMTSHQQLWNGVLLGGNHHCQVKNLASYTRVYIKGAASCSLSVSEKELTDKLVYLSTFR